MKRFLLFLAALLMLGIWTAFGYHEGIIAGIKKVSLPMVLDPETGDITPLHGPVQLFCLDPTGDISACVNYEHTKDGARVLLVPQDVLQDATPAPDAPKDQKAPSPTQK